jgi:hypothetical protein
LQDGPALHLLRSRPMEKTTEGTIPTVDIRLVEYDRSEFDFAEWLRRYAFRAGKEHAWDQLVMASPEVQKGEKTTGFSLLGIQRQLDGECEKIFVIEQGESAILGPRLLDEEQG